MIAGAKEDFFLVAISNFRGGCCGIYTLLAPTERGETPHQIIPLLALACVLRGKRRARAAGGQGYLQHYSGTEPIPFCHLPSEGEAIRTPFVRQWRSQPADGATVD